MKRLISISLLFLTVIISTHALIGQNKGSFDVNVSITTGTRPLCFYVPTDYDPAKKYSLMVCLHGSGQPANSYRDNLAIPLSNFIKNTIFVCPEGGGAAGDFYNAKGDEAIIDSAISYSRANYSIDEKSIILEGFSLGGRSALKYGLDNPGLLKGLLLNTPAVQSNLDANNHPVYSLKYNYKNAKNLPIAITHGSTDQGYYNIIDTVFRILTDNNSMAVFYRITGMGHSIPNQSVLQKCLDFINNPLKNNLDADIPCVMPPERTYEQKIKPLFRLRNMGATVLTTAEIEYSINGVKANYIWNGSLASFEHADVELPEVTCAENQNSLVVQISTINGVAASSSLSKKIDSAQFQSLTQGISLPYYFGFELTEPTTSLWGLHTAGGMVSWGIYTDTKTEGNNAIFMYNTPFFNINQGLSEDILSPLMDLTGVKNPCLTFDLGFNYIKLTTAGGYSQNYTFTDTLKIFISVDGGKTYKTIYSKSGSDLASVATPITNPQSLNACLFIPSSTGEWKNEVIKLDDYKENQKAVVVFKYVSGMGGSLWLDNLRFMSFDDITGISESFSDSGLEVYPNPATDFISLSIPESTKLIRIYDVTGSIVMQSVVNQGVGRMNIGTSGLSAGVYILEAIQDNSVTREKLIIK